MSDLLSDYRPDEALSYDEAIERRLALEKAHVELASLEPKRPSYTTFEEAQQAELVKDIVEKELKPYLPPPPHQLSPAQEAEEFERFRKEAIAELESTDEEYLFMHKAEEILDLHDRDSVVSLAIGYARIGEPGKAGELISDYYERTLAEQSGKLFRLSQEQIDLMVRDMRAEVAYYSGWKSFSTDEDRKRIAEGIKGEGLTKDFSHRLLLHNTAHSNYQEISDSVHSQGESAIYDALREYEQKAREFQDKKAKYQEQDRIERGNRRYNYSPQAQNRVFKLEYDQRLLTGLKNALAIVLMEWAAQKHDEHLDAINGVDKIAQRKVHLELS